MKASVLLLFLLINNFQEVFSKEKKKRCRKGYGANEPILIVISFDGFKTRYLNSSYKILTEKYEEGVKTEFQSLKFANALNIHHTIATGYFPNKHGVFAANWSDAKHKIVKFDRLQYENDLTRNNKILPIWTLNDLNGGTSACMMWPGCEHRYGPENEMSIFQHAYNQTEDYTSRLTKVIEWMNETVTLNPPNLIMIYFEQPDKFAHVYGPDASNLDPEIKKLDDFVKNLYKKLKLLKLLKRVDIVFLSDHRVTEIRYKDILDLRNKGVCNDVGLWGSDVWLQQQYFTRTSGNTSQINGEYSGYHSYYSQRDYPQSKCLQAIYEFQKFRSISMPEKQRAGWYYKYNYHPDEQHNFEVICPVDHINYVEIPRGIISNYTILMANTNSSPFVLKMDSNINLNYAAYGEMLYPKIKNWSAHYGFEVELCTKFGVHGYNCKETGFFLALGPSFVKNQTGKKFQCEDLYSLFARVLKIKGKFENDGKFARVKPLLIISLVEGGKQGVNWLKSIILIIICSIVHTILFWIAVKIYLARRKRKRRNRKRNRRRRSKTNK